MKFSRTIKATAVPEWRTNYINYSKLRKIIERFKSTERKDRETYQSYEREFYTCIEIEREKVNAFFLSRLEETERVWTNLQREILSLVFEIQQEIQIVGSAHEYMIDKNNFPSKEVKEVREMNENLNARFKALEVATTEYYVLIMKLNDFQKTNTEGFRKILKKYDKVFNTHDGGNYHKNTVLYSDFHTDQKTNNIITQVEDTYVAVFCGHERSEGMDKLRIPTSKSLYRIDCASFFFGIGLGSSVLLACFFGCFYFKNGLVFNEVDILILFSQLSLIFFVIAFSVNLYIWKRCAVNHVLIFEIDPRRNLNFVQCFSIGFLFLFFWLFSLFLYYIHPTSPFWRALVPVISYGIIIFLVIVPLLGPYRSSRSWVLRTIFKNFKSPFLPVRFADFWMYDQLCSLSVPISHAFGTCICYPIVVYMEKPPNTCLKPNIVFISLLRMIPFYIRFVQCVRRFKDFYSKSHYEMAHIFNAGKYLSSLIVIIFGEVYRSDGNNKIWLFWIVQFLRFISVNYLIFWDLWVDWSFFGTLSQIRTFDIGCTLRENIVYPSKVYYYMALFENVLIRYLAFLPPFYNFAFEDHKFSKVALSISMIFLEIIRRIIWNFFRLENEQLNNIGKYRVVRDVPFLRKYFSPKPSVVHIEEKKSNSSHSNQELLLIHNIPS